MPTIADIRTQYPDLGGLDDDQVVDALHEAFYQDLPRERVAASLGVKPPPAPVEPRGLLRTAGDVGISALKGAIGVPEAAVGLANLVTGGQAGKLAEQAGFRPKEAKAMLDEGYSPQQKAAFQKVQAAEGLGDTFMAAVQNPSVIAHSVVESVPSMGAGGVVARGGLALAPKLGGVVAGALGEGVVGAGAAAEQIRQQTPDGLTTGTQNGLAALTGGVTGVFSVLGGKISQKLGIADVDTMLAGAATNPVLRKGVVRSALEGAVSEGVLEELPQSVSEQVLQNMALNKPLDEGVNQAAVLGLLSGGAMGAGANVAASFSGGNVPTAGNGVSGLPAAPADPIAPVVPAGTLTRATASMAPGTIEEIAAANAPAPEPVPAPVEDAYEETINKLPDGMREQALKAYAVVKRDDVAKGVKMANQKLLDGLVEKFATDTQEAEEKAQKEPAAPATRAQPAINSIALDSRNVNPETGEIRPAFEVREADRLKQQADDILNAQNKPFTNLGAAKRTATALGDGFAPFKLGTNAFVVRKSGGTDVSTSTAVSDVSTDAAGSGGAVSPIGMGAGVGAGNPAVGTVDAGNVRAEPASDAVPSGDGRNDKAVKANLPTALAGAKPRYGYGARQFDLKFSSDLDRAAFISSQAEPSKRNAEYLKFAMDAGGMTEAQVIEHGQKVKAAIKEQAKESRETELSIPKIDRGATNVQNTPPAAAVKIETPAIEAPKTGAPVEARATATGTEAGAGAVEAAGVAPAKFPPMDIRVGQVVRKDGEDFTVTGSIKDGIAAKRVERQDGGITQEKTILLKGDDAFTARVDAVGQDVAAVNIKSAAAKLIPDMSDAEVLALKDYYKPENRRAAKITKEIEKRGLNQALAPTVPASVAIEKGATNEGPAKKAAAVPDDGAMGAEGGTQFSDAARPADGVRVDAEPVAAGVQPGQEKPGKTGKGDAATASSAIKSVVQKPQQIIQEFIPGANTVFTEDAAAAARAILKKKLGTVMSGIDPELLQAGLTLAGYHIEKGARTFSAYAKAMLTDLGDGVKPYLKSWYMGIKYDPRAAAFDGMDAPDVMESVNLDKLTADADTGGKDDGNATQQLDQPGKGALAGTPAQDVRTPGESRDAGNSTDGSGRGDVGRDASADDAGRQPAGGVGTGSGAVPVSAGRAKPDAKDAKKPRVSRARRADEGNGLFGDGTGGLTPAAGANPAPNAPVIAAPQIKAEDFTITDELALGEGGQKTKFKNNVAAIRLLADLEKTGHLATPEQQKVLAQYVGWGGLPQAFDGSNADWAKEHAEITSLMSPDELAAARQSTRYAHYTSREIIVDGIYAALRRFGFNGGKTLEAGAGVGNFMGMMPADMRSSGRFTAIEREPFSSAIARQLYPQQNVQQGDFTEFRGNDAYFDAAVGNPPFASDPQTDRSGRKHLSGLSLHNYFFAKSVDMLREGGIMAQVITNAFMDSKGETARKYIGDRVQLLGAVRLPNSAFSKNANTEVTIDIVFLQKRPDSEVGGKAAREDARRWLTAGQFKDAKGKTVALNKYFIDNPDMMLGEFGAHGSMYGPDQPALIARAGQDTLALLKEAVNKLPQGVYKSVAETGTTGHTQAAITALQSPTVREGGYFMDGENLMQRLPDLAGEARGVPVTADTQWTEKTKLGEIGLERIKALAGMRGTVRGLIAAEMGDDAKAMKSLRATLNTQYDAYRDTHGLINDPSTLRVFEDDPDFPLLASLEHGYTPGIGIAAAKRMGVKTAKSTAKKGPIFTQRVVAARQTVQKVETPADALQVSMAERGKLDAGYIGELLGMEPNAVLKTLSTGDKPLLFRDPASDEYVLRDAYLSGNVRAKLAQAQAAGAYSNAAALEAVQPAEVASHEIVARIGSPWVPTSVYADFAKSLFGDESSANVSYLKANSSYQLHVSGANSLALSNTWGTPDYPGDKLLGAMLNNRSIKVTYLDADKKTRTNIEATEIANTKAQELKDRFNDWLFSEPERSELLTKAYNETNNNYVTRVYDGSHMTFPGKVPDGIIKFRRHQRNAIARIVQDRTALLDHVVGAGKTFTVVSGAMELKRTGLARKPMVAVPNHLVKQWAADFYRLYPGANVLTATKKDFEKANRRKFLAKIATGDWDAVVIAHSSFGFIRPAPEFEAEFNGEQVKQIMATIESVEQGDGEKATKKRTIKQLEGMKERLENRIRALRDKPMDDLLDFEQLGVDQLFVDEAHMFKNLMFSTKMQQVQGLGDSAGSQRAYDMYVKAHQVYAKNGRGQGVVFATGTPVSNSLAEMYHMMRYLMPAQMKELGFESFDAWANTFASVEQVWMQAPSGDGFKASNRMSNFVNTTELLKMFDQVSDTVTMEDIQKAYSEENNGAEFPLPKIKGGRRTPVSLEKSPAQDAYMAEIAKRAKAIEQRRGPPKKGDDNILVVMGDARKAAMDIRLVDPNITEREKGGRIDTATDRVVERYHQYDKFKGTQLVFSDLGTPIKHAKAELKEYEALQQRIQAGDDDVNASAALGNEAAIAIMEDVEAAQGEMDGKGQDWLGAVQAALRGFSVYDDFKAALIEKGIPEAEIAFIHDYNTDDQKATLFRKMNAGQMRVLLGSTAKLGAGTNVQERLAAEHHLDVPWRPSDVEQREGRIIRQGNSLMKEIPAFEAEILAYVTKDTLDMRMWQVQETKLKMINQLRTRQVGREIDNAFEDMELSAGEMQAAATGDVNLLKEIQIRNDVKKLEQKRRSFEAQRNDLISRRRRVEANMKDLPAKLERAKADAKQAQEYFDGLKNNPAPFKLTIDGETYTDANQAQAYLREKTEAKVESTDLAGETTSRAAPVSIDINGETFKSRAAIAEAFSEARGDVEPILWAFNGDDYRRRTKLATALRQSIVDSIADEVEKPLGRIAGYDVAIEGQMAKDGITVIDLTMSRGGKVVLSKEITTNEPARAPERVVRVVENLLEGAVQEESWIQRNLDKAQKDARELESVSDGGAWPDEAKLDAARAAHKEVLAQLKKKDPVKAETEVEGDVAFGRSTNFSEAAQAQATEAVESQAMAIARRWSNAPEIVVAFDLQDSRIPQRIRDEDLKQRSGGAAGTPEGFYFKGKVYLMSSQLATKQDVTRVLAHEALGHFGLRGLYGKELTPILQQIAALRGIEVNAKMKEYGLRGVNNLERLVAAEEVLAEMAQTRPEIGYVKRAIAVIRTWLRRNVPGMKNIALTDDEIIQNYILPARGWVERGRQAAGAVGLVPAFARGEKQTPAFQKWFGDSKVVDADGNPLVVYHGTASDVGEFSATARKLSQHPSNVMGHFFTSDPAMASSYANSVMSTGQNVVPTFVSITNPLRFKSSETFYRAVEKRPDVAAWREQLKAQGYDGIIVGNMDEVVAFNSAQIKSAIGNNGDYDSNNPDIRFSRSLPASLASTINDAREVSLPAGYVVNDFFQSNGKLNWWHKTVGTQYNLAERNPTFKKVFDGVQNFIGDVSFYASEAADLAPSILPKMESWKDITKSPISAADNKAIAAPIFEGTLTWTRDGAGKPVKSSVMEEAAAKMSIDDKAQRLFQDDKITEGVLKMWRGLPIEQFEALVAGKYEREFLKPGIVFTPAELKSLFKLTDSQVALYSEFRAATDKSLTDMAVADMIRFGGKDVAAVRDDALDMGDVDAAAVLLRDHLMEQADGSERADVLIDTANKMIDKADRARDLMNRGYAPLSRFGSYSLDVVDENGERVYFGLFESKAEGNKMARQMRANFPAATINQGTMSDEEYKLFAGVSPETVELFGEMLGLESGEDGAGNEAFQQYLKLAKANRSAMKRLIQRKGIAGFSEDPGRVLAGFIYSNARQTSSGLHMGNIAQSVQDIPKGQGELKDAAVQLMDYVKNPQEEAQKIRGLLFAQYLGGSIASALVNLMQPMNVTFPWLSQYGGVGKAAGQMKNAVVDALKENTGDKVLDAALKKAAEDGIVSPQEVFQLMAQAQGKATLKPGDGTRTGDAMAVAGNAMSKMSLAWGKVFGLAEQFNRRTTFIAAYRTAVEQKMADPAAFAERAVQETQFVYNKGAKPRWARGAVGGVLFTFKSYSINYVELLSRMANNGPESRKAALLALGVLFLMSGSGGLPFSEDLDDVIDGLMQRLGYNFNSKQAKQEFFTGLLGRPGAEFVERGISGLAGVPIDVSGRLGMGNLIPSTGLLTKKQDYTRDVLELAGPIADLGKRAFQATGKLVDGNVLGRTGAIATMSPTAIRNLIQANDMANTGMYRDVNGRKVLDVDGYDVLAKAIGFQPNDVARVQEASGQVMNMVGQNKLRESEITAMWAQGVFEKDQDKVQNAKDALKLWNENNPAATIKIQMPQIIRRVKAMREDKTTRIARTAPKEIRATVRKELAES